MSGAPVVLDCDFISGITSYQDGDPADLFVRVFRALDKRPVVHEFVARHELTHDRVAQALIGQGRIGVVPMRVILARYPDGTGPDEALLLYGWSFEDMYRIIKHEQLPDGIDIFTRRAGMSFGEIHSILLADTLHIPLFYSNDGGARDAGRFHAAGRLQVKNAVEVAGDLAGSAVVTAKERHFIRDFYTRQGRGLRRDPPEEERRAAREAAAARTSPAERTGT